MASEPPEMLDENINVPSVNEVDDVLVNCIGQMAVATGSDSLWKHLNHEVKNISLVYSLFFFFFFFFFFL